MKAFFTRYVLVFAGLVIQTLYFGQGGWEKKYPLANSLTSVCRNVIEAPNGNLIMIGLTYDTIHNPGTNRLTIIGADPHGNIIWRKDYGGYTFEYLDNLLAPEAAVVTDQNYFYHTSGVRDSNNKYIGVIIKFNYNGDTIWQKIYRDPTQDLMPQGICKSIDGGLIITGAFQNWNNNTRPCLLLKTDINGNEIWRKVINKPAPNVHDGHSPVQDSSSKRIIVVGYQYIGANADTYSNILILDSLGNPITQKTFNNAGAGGFAKLIQLRDKNFLTCGAQNMNSDLGIYPRVKSLAVKFDIDGNIIWSKLYDTLSLYAGLGLAQELDNGDLIFGGSLDTLLNYGITEIVKPRIIKTNSNGDVIWKKYVGSAYTHTSSEFTTSLNKLSDNSFVVSTLLYFQSNNRPYSIVKVDSTGCDTLEAYCKWQESLAVNDLYQISGFDVDIFPNPANHFINVKIEAQQEMQFGISVADQVGRELQHATSLGGETKNLNTSELAPGLYFLLIKHEQRLVGREKFVVVK